MELANLDVKAVQVAVLHVQVRAELIVLATVLAVQVAELHAQVYAVENVTEDALDVQAVVLVLQDATTLVLDRVEEVAPMGAALVLHAKAVLDAKAVLAIANRHVLATA